MSQQRGDISTAADAAAGVVVWEALGCAQGSAACLEKLSDRREPEL